MPLPRYEANEGLSKEELLALVEARKVQRTGFPGGAADSNEGPGSMVGPVALANEGDGSADTDASTGRDAFLQSGTAVDTRPGQGGVMGTEASGGGMSGAGNEGGVMGGSGGPGAIGTDNVQHNMVQALAKGLITRKEYDDWIASGGGATPATVVTDPKLDVKPEVKLDPNDPWSKLDPNLQKYKGTDPSSRPAGEYPDYVILDPYSSGGMDMRQFPNGSKRGDGKTLWWANTTGQGGPDTSSLDSGTGSGDTGNVTTLPGSTYKRKPGDGSAVPVVDPIVATETSINNAQKLLDDFTAGTLDINGFMKNFGALLGQGADGMKELGIGGQPAGGTPPEMLNWLADHPNLGKIAQYLHDHDNKLPIRYFDAVEDDPSTLENDAQAGFWGFVDPFTGGALGNKDGSFDASGAAAQWEIEKSIFDSFVELQQYAQKGQLDAQYKAALEVLSDKLQSGRDLLTFTRNQALQKQADDAAAERADTNNEFIAGENATERAARLALQNDQQSFLSSEADKERLAREREAADRRKWESDLEGIKFKWNKELQDLNLEYQRSRDAMTNAISQGNLDLARQQFENSKLYEAKQIELKSRESTLSILATLGQYPHLRGALIASGLLEGANLGGANLGSVFGQAIPTGALPSLTALTQMPASQREATLNDLAGQYGVPVDQIVQMIQRNAPGSTGRLR